MKIALRSMLRVPLAGLLLANLFSVAPAAAANAKSKFVWIGMSWTRADQVGMMECTTEGRGLGGYLCSLSDPANEKVVLTLTFITTAFASDPACNGLRYSTEDQTDATWILSVIYKPKSPIWSWWLYAPVGSPRDEEAFGQNDTSKVMVRTVCNLLNHKGAERMSR